jgi:hypothetical protein
MNTATIHERQLQKMVHGFISEPSRILRTESGKRLQILSPGHINPHAGPDFLETAIFLQGYVIVGDIEFHRNCSDWFAHGHQNDPNYSSVILHIVFNNDSPGFKGEVLCLEPELLHEVSKKPSGDIKEIIKDIEDLQQFALIRLLRKTSEAKKLIKHSGLENAIEIYTRDYLNRYAAMRKRPAYNDERLRKITLAVCNSMAADFLYALRSEENLSIPDTMQEILKKRIHDEGAHLRREIILNSILPIAIALANEQSRINLFLWYWSVPALHQYGVLKRKFPDMPQNFLWQQQGMLEYMRNHGKRSNVVSEIVTEYGFAELLSFYRQGNSPFFVPDENDKNLSES